MFSESTSHRSQTRGWRWQRLHCHSCELGMTQMSSTRKMDEDVVSYHIHPWRINKRCAYLRGCVLVTFLLLWGKSWPRELMRKAFNMAYGFRSSNSRGREHGGRHMHGDIGAVAERSHVKQWGREPTGMVWTFETSKPSLRDIPPPIRPYLLQ